MNNRRGFIKKNALFLAATVAVMWIFVPLKVDAQKNEKNRPVCQKGREPLFLGRYR